MKKVWIIVLPNIWMWVALCEISKSSKIEKKPSSDLKPSFKATLKLFLKLMRARLHLAMDWLVNRFRAITRWGWAKTSHQHFNQGLCKPMRKLKQCSLMWLVGFTTIKKQHLNLWLVETMPSKKENRLSHRLGLRSSVKSKWILSSLNHSWQVSNM